MSFTSPPLEYSTTEPNTPEPEEIQSDIEDLPFGDFARIFPVSIAARLAFDQLVVAMNNDPSKYSWHRKFVHIRKGREEFEPETDELSTSDELEPLPQLKKPTSLYTGFWRLNMKLMPWNRRFGWVLGKGRWVTNNTNSGAQNTSGGVDILLTPDANDPSVRSRHARLTHSLDSFSLLVIADKRTRVGQVHLEPSSISALDQTHTAIAFGNLEYRISFTGLDRSLYTDQLTQFSKSLKYNGHTPGSFLDPTPADTDYMVMGKYNIKRSFVQGTTCWVCPAVVKNGGAIIAAKKIVALDARLLRHVHAEIAAMSRLKQSTKPYPKSLVKLVDSHIIAPSTPRGVTECFIFSEPLIQPTLASVITSSSLSMSDRLSLIEQMLEGLAFIHSEGCMHRDIRPGNVLVSSSPLQAVIIDFGCATFDKTSKDHMKGTIRYLAPEVIALKHGIASNDSTYNMSVDVWSLGLTAHELLSGSRTPRFSEITRKIYDHDLLPALGVNLRPNGDVHPQWAVSLLEEALRWDASTRIKSTDAHYRWLQQIQYTLPATLDPRKRLRMSEP